MCGILGILGHEPVAPHLIEALRRLEYRGSAPSFNHIFQILTPPPPGNLARLLLLKFCLSRGLHLNAQIDSCIDDP